MSKTKNKHMNHTKIEILAKGKIWFTLFKVKNVPSWTSDILPKKIIIDQVANLHLDILGNTLNLGFDILGK